MSGGAIHVETYTRERWELADGSTLAGVHSDEECSGHCPLHSPSDHHMVDWPLAWRGSGLFDTWSGFERTCQHGVGHLDPDTLAHMQSTGETPPPHGCDGCCETPDA